MRNHGWYCGRVWPSQPMITTLKHGFGDPFDSLRSRNHQLSSVQCYLQIHGFISDRKGSSFFVDSGTSHI